jgi:hypothetical protein
MTQINIFSIVKYPSLFHTTKNKTFIYTYIATENFTTSHLGNQLVQQISTVPHSPSYQYFTVYGYYIVFFLYIFRDFLKK